VRRGRGHLPAHSPRPCQWGWMRPTDTTICEVGLRTRPQESHSDIRTNDRKISWMDADRCDLLCLDLPKAERARSLLPDLHELERLSLLAKAMGDPTRLAVALALDESESACVCDLAWIVGRDEKVVSHHARLLKAAGIAKSARDGKMVIYQLTDTGRAIVRSLSELKATA
jgi:DNA-binding transcriptional ArsR family regulator